MRVLVAEDSTVSRFLLENALPQWGFEALIVDDGNRAWEILNMSDPPPLAILDWVMPGMKGPDICRELRKRNRNPYIYVLLLTGKRHQNDIVNGLESGADDYLTKPYNLDELRARLQVGKRIVELQQMLLEMASHDSLTELQNHGSILESLQAEMERSTRMHTSLSIILADMDHFKRINDTYDHQAGDAVLKEIAHRIRISTRPYDLVGRYGGEEFLIVLPNCSLNKAVKHAERIRRVIEHPPVMYMQEPIPMTVSLGVSGYDWQNPADINTFVSKADDALYQAKNNGRNRVEAAA